MEESSVAHDKGYLTAITLFNSICEAYEPSFRAWYGSLKSNIEVAIHDLSNYHIPT